MLKEKEIEKIKKLIDQGYSDYEISNEKGHSINTIKKYRVKINKIEETKNQKFEEIVHLEDPYLVINQVSEYVKNIVFKLKEDSRVKLRKN